MRFSATALIVTLGIALSPAGAAGGPVTGNIKTLTRPGTSSAPVVVYAEPLDSAPSRRPANVALTQKDKTFRPRVLAVPIGSTVEFPNQDTVFHNVFSLSGPQPFDLGLYRAGASRSRMFAQPGEYRVFCNIHPQMTALILVVATPYVAHAGPDGRFVVDLPPGRYKLTAMSERASPVSVEIVAAAGATTAPDLTLDESAWIDAKHKNKFGQEYPAAAYKR
jgi:plastocyanin